MSEKQKEPLLDHIHDFLREKNLFQTLRSLETESGIYLDVSHVQQLIRNGDWGLLHSYLSGFFSYGDDSTTMEISFEIKKQKFFEALKKGQHAEAVAILFKEGDTFRRVYGKQLNDLLLLTVAEDPWKDELSKGYNDETTSRATLCAWIQATFQNYPGLREKMKLPDVKDSVLSVVRKHQDISVALSPAAIFPVQELPKATLTEISPAFVMTCIEFHPIYEDVLVAGAIGGDVIARKVGSCSLKWFKKFQVINPVRAYTMEFQSVLVNKESNTVTCLRWTPSGRYLGVGFSKHLFQLMEFGVDAGFRVEMECEAHRGAVNDIAFYNRNEKLFIVTCGNDGLVKIWNQTNSLKPFITLQGHSGSVKSVSFCERERGGFVFSTSNMGKIKIWNVGDLEKESVQFESPGCFFRSVMSKWGDGRSLFTIETGMEDMLPSITEWNVGETSTSLTSKRKYVGMPKRRHGHLTFDNNGRLLVAADKECLKFWDVNNGECLWTITMSPQLQDAPIVRVSKNGLYLAVLASKTCIKIFGNITGLKLAFAHASAAPMPPSSVAQYRFSAKELGVDNLEDTMLTFDVPSLSIDRAKDVEFRGHDPQMLNANTALNLSSRQALLLKRLASQGASGSSSQDKHKVARQL